MKCILSTAQSYLFYRCIPNHRTTFFLKKVLNVKLTFLQFCDCFSVKNSITDRTHVIWAFFYFFWKHVIQESKSLQSFFVFVFVFNNIVIMTKPVSKHIFSLLVRVQHRTLFFREFLASQNFSFLSFTYLTCTCSKLNAIDCCIRANWSVSISQTVCT